MKLFCLKIAFVFMVLVSLAGQARADMFSGVTLGQAGSLNMGIFVTGATQINASNSSTYFNTNMGLASGASTNFSGNGTLAGTLYKDPGATVQGNISSQFNVNGGITSQSLAQAVSDAQAAASAAMALSANQTYGSVGGSALTISATGALNSQGGHNTVVDMSSISITNPSNNLTFTGGANDYYIVNVTGTISVTNGSILASGVPISHILFNVEGTGNSVSLSNGASVLDGTFLAPNANQKITLSPGTVNGGIIGYQIQTSSGPTVNGQLYSAPSAVPVPPSILLLAPGLFGLVALRKRLKNSSHID